MTNAIKAWSSTPIANFRASFTTIRRRRKAITPANSSPTLLRDSCAKPRAGAPLTTESTSSGKKGGTSPSGGSGDEWVDSGLEAEALLLLGETFLKMHKWSDARDAFASIVRDYTKSSLVEQAKNYLDYMRSQGV